MSAADEGRTGPDQIRLRHSESLPPHPRAGRCRVSVVILTINEATNIARCLRALDWCEDVVLVDSGSTDQTLSIAREVRPDVRIFEHDFEDFGQQRNFALDQTGLPYEWVLFLDADEVCPPELAVQIRQVVETPLGPGEPIAYFLTCRNLFLGRWLKRCTLYPSWQLRLLKRGEVRYRREGHGQREVTDGPIGYLDQPYDHYGFSQGIEHWIARHNHYSTAEVELIHRMRREPLAPGDLWSGDPVRRRRCLKRMSARVGCRPLFRFLYLYVIRRGFLDGTAGWIFCQLRVAHEIHITAKLAEEESRQRLAGETAQQPGTAQLPPAAETFAPLPLDTL